MSTSPIPPTQASELSPFCIYTIRHSRNLASDHEQGGSGKFTERKRWTGALGLLDRARKVGQQLPIVFAAGETIDGVIYSAFIDDLDVSQADECRNGTTTIRFSGLRPLPKKRPLSSLRLKSSGQQLSDGFIRPYAICYTPDFFPTSRNT
jgi:hypothetical protein